MKVAELGLPKLYAPTVTGAVPGTLRFRARLSALLPWTVDVYDAAGATLASSSGFGAEVDWRWDASLLPPGSYTYAIRAGSDLLEICHSAELILRSYEALISEGERSAAFRKFALSLAKAFSIGLKSGL